MTRVRQHPGSSGHIYTASHARTGRQDKGDATKQAPGRIPRAGRFRPTGLDIRVFCCGLRKGSAPTTSGAFTQARLASVTGSQPLSQP